MRLNRYLSQCGLGSRRGCEQIILEGRVAINGRQVKELGTLVNPGDEVAVDGKAVRTEAGVVIALNKPRGYICTRSDERDRMTIYDLLPRQFQTLHHVGRLDKESEGLLLLTNRGDLSHHLIHPSKGAEKEYEVIVDQPLDQTIMAKLVKGMLTEEGHARAERAWMITEYRCHVVLKQGLKRQIRLMFYQLGFEVERLTRTRIGWLELKGLPKGGWKELSATEVERFFSKEGATGRAPKQARAKPVAGAEDDDEGDNFRPATKKRPATAKKAARRSGPGGAGSRSHDSRRPDSRGQATGDRGEGARRSFGRGRSASSSSGPGAGPASSRPAGKRAPGKRGGPPKRRPPRGE